MLQVGHPGQGHVLSPSTDPITRSLGTLSILSDSAEHQVLLSSLTSCCIQGNNPQLSGLQKVRLRSHSVYLCQDPCLKKSQTQGRCQHPP